VAGNRRRVTDQSRAFVAGESALQLRDGRLATAPTLAFARSVRAVHLPLAWPSRIDVRIDVTPTFARPRILEPDQMPPMSAPPARRSPVTMDVMFELFDNELLISDNAVHHVANRNYAN
jgi:hypothetical protein